MKKLIALLSLLLTLLLAQSAFAALTRLADNVYAYVGSTDAAPSHSFAANAGIVIGRDGVLVVDTLISAREGERFLADIRAVTDKPIRYVVNTHTHLDHALGNGVFAKLGATLIAHEADRALLATQGAAILQRAGSYGLKPEEMVGTEVVVPTLAFSDRMTIDLGDTEVQLLRFAPSHTAGSLVVYLPAQKLLFSGDILFTDFHPNLTDADLDGWTKTLDHLLGMDITQIVPGHGPLSTKKDLQEMRAYIVLFDSKARELATTTQDPAIIATELLKILPKRTLAEWMVAHNVAGRYVTKK